MVLTTFACSEAGSEHLRKLQAMNGTQNPCFKETTVQEDVQEDMCYRKLELFVLGFSFHPLTV